MHALYIFKHFLKFLVLIVPLQLASYVIVAITLLFYLKDKRVGSNLRDQRLPKFLTWLDNGDEWDRDNGLNGDLNFQSNYKLDSIWSIYLMRYTWLAVRNPLNTFKRRVLGIKRTDIIELLDVSNKPVTGNIDDEVGDWTYSGTRYMRIRNQEGIEVREYYGVWLLPKFLGDNKCIRIRIGHKIGHNPISSNKPFISFVLVIQPYKKFKGHY